MANNTEKKKTAVTEAEQLKLPFWSSNFRVMPNDFSRSALFTVRNKQTKRSVMEKVVLYHYNNDVSIEFTGIELRAYDDELVWQQVLDYAKEYPLGSEIRFTFYQLCQDLGWSVNAKYYERIEKCLSRLKANSLNFRSKRLQQLEAFSLLNKFKIDMANGRRGDIMVVIDPVIHHLFTGNHYSKMEWVQYRALKPIARRLYDYFASHRDPYPLSLDKFSKMCGSESAHARKWREMTKAACEELVSVGLVKWASVTSDKVKGSRYSEYLEDNAESDETYTLQSPSDASKAGQMDFYDTELAEIDKGLDALEDSFKKTMGRS